MLFCKRHQDLKTTLWSTLARSAIPWQSDGWTSCMENRDETKTVFYDENAIRYFDPDNSDDEDRFLMVGLSNKLRILIVCHCFREEDSVIRIITARKATKSEEDNYWRERT